MVDLVISKETFRRWQQALGDAVSEKLDEAVRQVLTSSESWGPSPLNSYVSAMNLSLAASQTELGRSIMDEYVTWEREQYQRQRLNEYERRTLLQGSWDTSNGCNCEECRNLRGQQVDNNDSGKRARALLLSCLTKKQKEDFLAYSSFNVKAPSGNKYRIDCGKTYNVSRLNKNGKDIKLCAGPKGINLSVYDWMLAQKCILETDEESFLKVANGI